MGVAALDPSYAVPYTTLPQVGQAERKPPALHSSQRVPYRYLLG